MAEIEQPIADTSKVVDYAATIERLQRRAKSARWNVAFVGCLLAVVTYIAVWSLVQRVTSSSSLSSLVVSAMKQPYTGKLSDLFTITTDRVSVALSNRASRLVGVLNADDFVTGDAPPGKRPPAAVATTRQQLKETLDELERAVQIESKQPNETTSEWQGLASTLVLSVGAVGLLILMIQIAVGFMRYYVRVAETYDAQADAFLASGGNPKLAAEFLKHLHVDVDLGATPATIYEKALDTVKEAVSRRG